MRQPIFSVQAPLRIAAGIVLLPRRAGPEILAEGQRLLSAHTPRRMMTPWGKKMSVAMMNCGPLGWISDAGGYRYDDTDPLTSQRWPPMPDALRCLAIAAAAEAGYGGFEPQACLVNLYRPDSRMGLHQDRDETDLTQPIVSVSLGRSALFRIGGCRRADPTRAIRLDDGDIIVFGGPARLIFHGIDRLDGPEHPVLGESRINLTFRRVTASAVDA